MKFASLKYDYLFKKVFSDEKILRRFISDVTGIPLSEIKSVRIVNPHLLKRRRGDKEGILDIALILNDDARIDIELQLRHKDPWEKRSLFYLAKMYTEDLKHGQDYDRLRKCISISVLDFNLTQTDKDRNHSVYTLREADGKEFTDLFEIHVIELKKKTHNNDALDDWIRLFNADTKEKLDKLDSRIEEVNEAVEVVREINLAKRLRVAYEMRLKARRDRVAEDRYVRNQGRAEGRAEGKVSHLIGLVCAKLAKGKSIEVIVSELEETPEKIGEICAIASKYAPDYDADKILEEYLFEKYQNKRKTDN